MRRLTLTLTALRAPACDIRLLAATPSVSAAPSDVVAVVVDGTGFGHGRGMSQWGAYGWAVDYGATWDQIVEHYYRGTVMGDIASTDRISVRLLGLDNAPSVAVVGHGPDLARGGPTSIEHFERSATPVARSTCTPASTSPVGPERCTSARPCR